MASLDSTTDSGRLGFALITLWAVLTLVFFIVRIVPGDPAMPSIRRSSSHNVVGIVPGTKRPDEYVLYTAHWDHLGRCTPVDGDDICNGALDNATGVAGLSTLPLSQKGAGTERWHRQSQ